MDMKSASALYRLLGDEARLRILRLLAAERLNVSELTAVLGIAQSGVSRHLGLLKESGLVQEQREGGFTYYRAAGDQTGRGAGTGAAAPGAPARLGGARGAVRRLGGGRERAGRRGAAEGSAAAAQGELCHPRRRRAAAGSGPQLGGVVAGARPAAAAAGRRRSRMRRWLPDDRDRAVGAARRGRSTARARCSAAARELAARRGVAQHHVEARRAGGAAARRCVGGRRAALAGAAPRRGPARSRSPRPSAS